MKLCLISGILSILLLPVAPRVAQAEMTIIYNPPKKTAAERTDPEQLCLNECGTKIMNKYYIPGLSQTVPGAKEEKRPRMPSSPSTMERMVKECTKDCLKRQDKN